jgi:hypothetical protein
VKNKNGTTFFHPVVKYLQLAVAVVGGVGNCYLSQCFVSLHSRQQHNFFQFCLSKIPLLYRYFCFAQQQVLFLFLIITLYYEYQLGRFSCFTATSSSWSRRNKKKTTLYVRIIIAVFCLSLSSFCYVAVKTIFHFYVFSSS